jgi:hypothetical protein
VLNCEGLPVLRVGREERYRPEWGILEYDEILAQDTETYDIAYHFRKVFKFIDTALIHGRCLIYGPDVNRSGALGIAFLMHKGVPLFDSAKTLKFKRKLTLFNVGFMKQLIIFAKDHGLLEREIKKTHLANEHFAKHGRVKYRPVDSHLLQFV